MGRNGFFQKRDERDQYFFQAGMSTGIQMAADFITLFLRCRKTMCKDVFGRSRILKILNRSKEFDDYFHSAFSQDKEADYKQEEMDAMLWEVYGEDLIPFQERYNYLKKVGYKKPLKGWVD